MVMLDLLLSGKKIINVDQSWVNETNFTNMMWCQGPTACTITSKAVTPRLAIIAALSTNGDIYFSLTQCNTDSEILMLFFKHLITLLDSQDASWKNDSVFLLDGATYHTSAEMRGYFRKMGVEVIYSGPYSYSAAPIELLFAALKRGELNPDRLATGKK